ncbi:hypothetical protein [Burkholderia ubonensis]|uniref:hypothetical protein n=1 Tax=Burkholderia ubonensis TaxID=101571 RepID=UPI0012FA4CF3|nr:hypothetical protein [Burkholderia ubonensis]
MTPDDLPTFHVELDRDDLSCYAAVVPARRDALAGDIASAVARLRVDADQIRMVSPRLARLTAAQ